MGYCYGVYRGDVLVRTFSDHGDAVDYASELLGSWYGGVEVRWWGYRL